MLGSQVKKAVDFRSYGDHRFSRGESFAYQIIICPTCRGKGLLPKALPPRPQSYQMGEPINYLQNEVPGTISDPTVSSRNDSRKTKVTRLHSVHIPSTNGSGSLKSEQTPLLLNIKNRKVSDSVKLKSITFEKIERGVEEIVGRALMKLNNIDWEVKKEGVDECLCIAQHYPDELELHMSQVYRALRYLLTNHRPKDTIFVCHAARRFFAHMRSTCRPEYDEFINALLIRTADSNKYVRCYVYDALDKMVTYIPTMHAIRPLVEKGCKHRNPLVRSTTARLLADIVMFRTPNAFLTFPQLREACSKVIEVGALLLGDNNLGTRTAAKNLFSKLMMGDEFESFYHSEVDDETKNKIDRTICELRHKNQVQT